jgi:nucleoside 2-deoxyribosyltransferase
MVSILSVVVNGSRKSIEAVVSACKFIKFYGLPDCPLLQSAVVVPAAFLQSFVSICFAIGRRCLKVLRLTGKFVLICLFQAIKLMKLYLAGPDVFRQDATAWAETARRQTAAAGHQALIPLDGVETTASGIYHANFALIRAADAVLANLNPFRGAEPDSGTCVEVGIALALGKPVIGYLAGNETMTQRVAKLLGAICRRLWLFWPKAGCDLSTMTARRCRRWPFSC